METEDVRKVLRTIVHPETGRDLVTEGIAHVTAADEERIAVTLAFARPRDPFALPLKRSVREALAAAFPDRAAQMTITVREGPAPTKPAPAPATGTEEVGHVVAVASGKGGVGKSTVAANLALALRDAGYRVGLLDADIYGPSQPKMFGVEGYVPEAAVRDGVEYILPAEPMGIRLMSIGFFIAPGDALIWRGPMATNALRQMIHQTAWGALDVLLVDLPPGTGDVHLSILHELRVDGAVIVSTPQQVAVADVERGIALFEAEKIAVPVLGLVENMAWFAPSDLPDRRYYLFGRGGARQLAERKGIPLLGEIPITESLMEGAEQGRPAVCSDPTIEAAYRSVALRITEQLCGKTPDKRGKTCQ